MTKPEIENILFLLESNYPMAYKNMNPKASNVMKNTWYLIFKNDDYSEVSNVILNIIASDTSSFPPVIGVIKSELNKKFSDCVMDSEKAWAVVVNNAKIDTRQAQTNFDKLSYSIKKAVQSYTFLVELGHESKNRHASYKKTFEQRYKEVLKNNFDDLNKGAITHLQYCQMNGIDNETIKYLASTSSALRIETKGE